MKKAKEGSFLRRVSVVTRIRDRSRNSGEARQLEITKRMSRTDERMKRDLCSPSLLAHTLSLTQHNYTRFKVALSLTDDKFIPPKKKVVRASAE